MAFSTALSGIQAASSDLDIIGNNIANASTTGFKYARAEFADVYSASLSSNGTAIGQGVTLQSAAQQFAQGSISFTDNALDLAISGDGFFQLDSNGTPAYTRAGSFKLDSAGNVVNNEGFSLMARQADSSGAFTGSIAPLQLNTGLVNANPTSLLNAGINFDAREAETDGSWAIVGGLPVSAGYNSSTTASVFDSLGNDHTVSMYFSKLGPPNEWNVRTMIDGVLQHTGSVSFNDDGSFNAMTNPYGDMGSRWRRGGRPDLRYRSVREHTVRQQFRRQQPGPGRLHRRPVARYRC